MDPNVLLCAFKKKKIIIKPTLPTQQTTLHQINQNYLSITNEPIYRKHTTEATQTKLSIQLISTIRAQATVYSSEKQPNMNHAKELTHLNKSQRTIALNPSTQTHQTEPSTLKPQHQNQQTEPVKLNPSK